MTQLTDHHRAMELADKADHAKQLGSMTEAAELLRDAFRYESRAAMKLRDEWDAEPTRSVLFRSAASLALECGERREAERMIAFGLSGDPPAEIAEELRDLLEEVYFERHPKARNGMLLTPDPTTIAIVHRTIRDLLRDTREDSNLP